MAYGDGNEHQPGASGTDKQAPPELEEQSYNYQAYKVEAQPAKPTQMEENKLPLYMRPDGSQSCQDR